MTDENAMNSEFGAVAYIDDQPVDLDEIGPPAMNYGQFHRWAGLCRRRYKYEMPQAAFIDRVSGWFEEYRRGLREDDLTFPPDAGSDEADYAALGYPQLETLIASHSSLAVRILMSEALELNNLFAPRISDRLRYAANSVDLVEISASRIRFGGVAFDMKTRELD